MDIHHPKEPIHSWRDFLKEVGIIVLGVLIALGAEQTVEALHWREQTALTQRELRDEIALNVNSAAEWVAVSDCASMRVDSLYARLAEGHEAWSAAPQGYGSSPASPRPASIPAVFRLPMRPFASGTWETARSNGALSHVSTGEMGKYDALFDEISALGRLQMERTALKDQLQPLAVRQTLDDAERIGMEATVARLAGNFSNTALLAEQFIERARRDGIVPDTALGTVRYGRLIALWGSCVVTPADVVARARQSLEDAPAPRPQPVQGP